MADTVIAPDLRELYDSAEGWPLSKRVRELIERCSKAEAENVALRDKIERLEAPPLTFEVYTAQDGASTKSMREILSEFIAARGREGE